MATLSNLPVELFSRVADYASAKVALSLPLASGRAAPLGEAFRAANELRRMSDEDAGDDDALFRRWEALVVPLRCVVAEMSRRLFGRVFRGAARRGLAALSMLDASRLDLDVARRGQFQVSVDEALEKAWEQIQHMDGLPEGFGREDMLEMVKEDSRSTTTLDKRVPLTHPYSLRNRLAPQKPMPCCKKFTSWRG